MSLSNQTAPVHFILWGAIVVILIRLVLVFTMGMMPQDAYYYFYSENLSLSYFDHPPMVAWMLKIFSLVLGKSVIGVKLTDFIVTGLTVYAFYHLAKKFFDGFLIERSLFLLISTMMISILSLVTTPDVPLLLFWTLSVLFFFKAVEKNETKDWMIAGMMAGFAFDSKYTALALWIGLFGYLITQPEKRKLLQSYKPYLSILIFVLAISPVLIWNFQHDWLSLRFQSSDRVDDMAISNIELKNFFGNLGTQLFILLPVLYIFVLYAVFRVTRDFFHTRFRPDSSKWFLWWFSAPLILGFMAISIVYWVKLNWTMPAYIAGIILAVYYIPRKWVRAQMIISLIFHFLFLIQVLFYPFPIQSDDTWWGWEKLSNEVDKLQENYPDVFIFSDDGYKTSAQLSFHLNQKIYSGNVIGNDGLQFSIVDPDLTHLIGQDAIFIDSAKRFKHENKSDKKQPELFEYFESVRQLEPIILDDQNGEPERKFLVYYLENYKGG